MMTGVRSTVPDDAVPVDCPICGPRPQTLFAHCDGLRIVRCVDCSLLFVNPQPPAAARAEHFRHQYIADDRRVAVELVAFREDCLRREAARLKAARPEGGRLLDVGAASGAFLRQFENAPSWRVEGVEPSTFASNYARETMGLTVHTGFLRDCHFPSSTFDVVTSLDTFMLHQEPASDLAEMVRILRPGGLLAMDIPGLWFRLHKNKGPVCRLLYGVPVRLNPRIHLYYYSRSTLTRLCARQGLELVASYPEGSPVRGPLLQRAVTSGYARLAALLYRLSGGTINVAPKEFLIFRKSAV